MHPLWADVRAEGSEALPPPPDFSNEPPLLRWKSEDYEVCRARFTGLCTSLMSARARLRSFAAAGRGVRAARARHAMRQGYESSSGTVRAFRCPWPVYARAGGNARELAEPSQLAPRLMRTRGAWARIRISGFKFPLEVQNLTEASRVPIRGCSVRLRR